MDVQLSMFDLPELMSDEQSELYAILKRGSGFEGGCLRIYAAEQTLEQARFEMFLSDEFGNGGHSVKGGFCDYSGKGLVIRRLGDERETRYSWRQIAKAYQLMIRTGAFPEQKVLDQYAEVRKAGKGAPAPRMHYW